MVDRVKFENMDVVGPEHTERIEKKPFVAPKISVPVDVLEATTFFQSTESGVTN